MASALSPTTSLGRPGRWTSPAEIMVVSTPLSPDSMKSNVRWRGVKSPKTGWQWESSNPGITVVPLASMTVSASPSSPLPTAEIFPPSITIVSPSSSGRWRSPETIAPIPRITVFISLSPSPGAGTRCGCSPPDAQIPQQNLRVRGQCLRRRFIPYGPVLQQHHPIGHAECQIDLLLHQEHPYLTGFQGPDGVEEPSDQGRHESLARLVHQQHLRARAERSGGGQHLLLPATQRPRALSESRAKRGKEIENPVQRLVTAALEQKSHLEILPDCQEGENPPALRHVADPEARDFVRPKPGQLPPVKREIPGPWLHQPHNGSECRRLARAVPTEEAEDLPRRKLKRDILEDVDVPIVAVNAVQPQHHRPRYTFCTSGCVSISWGVPSARRPPLSITVTFVARSNTTAMLCSMSRMVTPRERARMSRERAVISSGARPWVGSSRISISGRRASAMATSRSF